MNDIVTRFENFMDEIEKADIESCETCRLNPKNNSKAYGYMVVIGTCALPCDNFSSWKQIK